MGKKWLVRNLKVDYVDWSRFESQDNGEMHFIDTEDDKVIYKRFSRKIERWENSVRTHTFWFKIPAHKWYDFVLDVFDEVIEENNQWERLAIVQSNAKTWQEYVEGHNYSDDEIEEIKQAFTELKVYAENHSVEEYFEERERLGLIT